MPYEALSLMACYVRSVQPAMNISLERRGGMIVMEVFGWNPLAFSNFVASLNVEVRIRCGIDQQSKFAPFLLQSQFRKTFLTFPDVEVFLTVFLHQYLSALKLQQVRSVPAAVPVPENFSDISGCRGIPDSLSASISFCIEIARNSLDVVDMVSLLG